MKSIYEETVPEEERTRQRDLGARAPLLISQRVIGDPKGKTVLDLGSGASTALGQWVTQRGGTYTAFDNDEACLREHRFAQHATIDGDVRRLSIGLGSFNVVHSRLMLMHFDRADKEKIVTGACRIAKNRVLFLEPDWDTFNGNLTVGSLRYFAEGILGRRANLYLGKVLGHRIQNMLPSAASDWEMLQESFPPEETTDYGELIAIAAALVDLTKNHAEVVRKELQEISAAIALEAKRERPDTYTLPQFSLVEIRKL